MQRSITSPTQLPKEQRSFMISTKIPKEMHNRLLEAVIKDNYGMRGKSKWVCQAIESFLQLPQYPQLVEVATDINALSSVTLTIRISEDLNKAIDSAVVSVRKEYPILEGVKSNIVRASIVQRMLGVQV